MRKFIAKLWFCKILNEHTMHIHVDLDKNTVLRCKRCGMRIKDKDVLDELDVLDESDED